jgi:hypothetical protein
VIWSAEDEGAFEDTLKLAVAIVPLEMVLVLIPHAMHFTEPTPLVQESDLLAEVAAGPACRLISVRSLPE